MYDKRPTTGEVIRPMESRLSRTVLFALYQLSVLIGIALLPVALVARRAGIPLPIHRAIDRLASAYEHSTEQP